MSRLPAGAPSRTLLGLGLTLVLASQLITSGVAAAAGHDTDGDGLSNAWETHWGLTDPTLWDSNHNGIIDSAEDPDGDGLSNLGEQRFHTNPGSADTNGNGTSDYREDSNANGIADGLEQDHRSVPGNLRPSLAQAPGDTPVSYSNGCHTFQGSATIHPCVFGDPHGTTTVAVFGDSHALQWVPGLTAAAKRNHWRLVAITKSACPSVDVRFHSGAFPNDAGPCRTWRQRAITWLGRHVPELIILSNSRGYSLVDAQGHAVLRDPEWGRGLARTLSALPSAARLLVLGDTPHMKHNVPTCLKAHPSNISACETSRGASESRKHDATERTTAQAHGATFQSLDALVCSYDPCPVIEGNVVMWRNSTHLTATWAAQLWPSLATLVGNALATAA